MWKDQLRLKTKANSNWKRKHFIRCNIPVVTQAAVYIKYNLQLFKTTNNSFHNEHDDIAVVGTDVERGRLEVVNLSTGQSLRSIGGSLWL